MIEIPLTSSPEQNFSIILNGVNYDIRVILNSRLVSWSISLSKEAINILDGVALLGGIDIMSQYNLPIKNMYIVNLNNPNQDASDTGLGTVSRLFLLTDEEIESGSSI